MSNSMSKLMIGISYNLKYCMFGLWRTTAYFIHKELSLSVIVDGTQYFVPLLKLEDIPSEDRNDLQIRFSYQNEVYCLPLYPFSGYWVWTLYGYPCHLRINRIIMPGDRLCYNFRYGIYNDSGYEYLKAVACKIHVQVISRNGDSSFLSDFSLSFKEEKTFDSDVDGFKDYDSYTECGEEVQGAPIYPDSETIRVTFDGVDGYWDVELSNKKKIASYGNGNSINVRIPVRDGGEWKQDVDDITIFVE